MSTFRRRAITLAVGSIALLVPVVPSVASVAAPAVTQVVDLGTLGGTSSIARDVNSGGTVVGASQREGDTFTRAFQWTSAAHMHGLGTLGGTNSDAIAINDRGQVVGWSDVPGGAHHAFLWQSATGMRDLGTLGGPSSEAVAINDAGVVIGMSDLLGGGFTRHAFVWDAVNGMRDLGLGDAGVRGINEVGQIVGTSGTAFVWDPIHGMRNLGTLGGSGSNAMAINETGQVVGGADDPVTGPDVAVTWSAAGVIRSMGTLPASGPWSPGCCSGAWDINDNGVAVGWALVDGDDVSRAFVWDATNGIRDLGTLGGDEATAYGINNSGTIVGESLRVDGKQHATMWKLSTDATPPTLTCTGSAPVFLLHQDGARLTATVADAGSGPASATVTAVADVASVGSRTVMLTGADNAGNTSSIACPYSVQFRVAAGFFRGAVDGDGIVNVAAAGRTVPVRWQITDAKGVAVANVTSVVVTSPTTTIAGGTKTDKIEWYATGSPGLKYLSEGMYQYNWKTPTSYAGTSRLLRIDLGEGVVRTAVFRFTP